MANSINQYIDIYSGNHATICSGSAPVMNAVRDTAFADFRRLGFPTRKVERYKYIDTAEYFAPDYGLNLRGLNIPVNPYSAFKCGVPNLSTSLYFVVNDRFYTAALPKASLPDGVIVGSLREYAEKCDFIADYYGRIAATSDDAVTALNTMLAQDGLLVYVPKNVKVERAIQVVNILRGDVDMMVNRRVLVIVEDGAEVQLLFCDDTADGCNFLGTQVVEAFVGERTSLKMYCLEETHAKNTRFSNVYISQQRDSSVSHNIVTLHNGVTRNRLDVMMEGEGAECTLNGAVIGDKNQHIDNNTLISHKAPNQSSRQLYKYVLDDDAQGAFAGRVLVNPAAQKINSREINQNLLASDNARMFTQPMLEIYADDVKCSHGSTVGQLNDQALFYMRQRGISLQEARTLLQLAFINEVVDNIELQPLRDRLHHLVEMRFRGKLGNCALCAN